MNKRTNLAVAIASLLCSAATGFARTATCRAAGEDSYVVAGPAPGAGRGYTVNNKKMPLISVNGNRFVDPDGKPVLFRGLAISDPESSDAGTLEQGSFVKSRDGDQACADSRASRGWRERGPSGIHQTARPGRGVVYRSGHVRHHRLALHRQHDHGCLPGPDVRYQQGRDLRVLARDVPAYGNPQHRGFLRAVQRAGGVRQGQLGSLEDHRGG